MRRALVIRRMVAGTAAGLALILVVAAGFAEEGPPGKLRKVLVIGIDRCRFDALRAARTPHLDRLIREGAFDAASQILGRRYQGNDTVSGPGWSSILTGVWADKHGVDDNKFSAPNYREFPHFFARLKQVRPEARTVSLVTWEPWGSNEGGKGGSGEGAKGDEADLY